jgi:hypothetical protein
LIVFVVDRTDTSASHRVGVYHAVGDEVATKRFVRSYMGQYVQEYVGTYVEQYINEALGGDY